MHCHAMSQNLTLAANFSPLSVEIIEMVEIRPVIDFLVFHCFKEAWKLYQAIDNGAKLLLGS